MPSRPMFTMPARSLSNPPRPASKMGNVSAIVLVTVNSEVRSFSPETARANDSTRNAPKNISMICRERDIVVHQLAFGSARST
ncbi:unannotated protein [freshwater metagenome]|uniref:Unannotated protein n=1 Tax=freshwater metagenome TaxID=449393 RepID=A0A6J6Z236_9ZZZZ